LDVRIRLICFAIPAVDFVCVEENIRDRICVVFKLWDTLFNDAESTAAFEGDNKGKVKCTLVQALR